MNAIRYSEDLAENWDRFCVKDPQTATFLHTRRFLSYHKNRFEDVSLVINGKGNGIVAVFPAAIDPLDKGRVVSHPGATYGGLIYSGRTNVQQVHEMLRTVCEWYIDQGFSSLTYKTVPLHFHKCISFVDQYLLWRNNGIISRRDLWNALPLDQPRSLSKGRKWAVKKALSYGVEVARATKKNDYKTFHSILDANLREKHGTSPVHSCEEMWEISERFPEQISLWLARDTQDRPCAGAWLFHFYNRVAHTQYIASTESGQELFAADLLLETIIRNFQAEGYKCFSFGASTEHNGRFVNEGLFDFKSGFGVGSVVQDFFEIRLGENPLGVAEK
jgi:hypothetical protein